MAAKVTASEIKEFGQKHDPQPFRLDEGGWRGGVFQGACCVGMANRCARLRVQSITGAGGITGAGVEEMRWTAPVRPGDTLQVEIEVIEVQSSDLCWILPKASRSLS